MMTIHNNLQVLCVIAQKYITAGLEAALEAADRTSLESLASCFCPSPQIALELDPEKTTQIKGY